MYGGVTNYEGNHLDNHKSQTIYVKVFENSKHIITFEIQADKNWLQHKNWMQRRENF